jgi:hypothetical protein
MIEMAGKGFDMSGDISNPWLTRVGDRWGHFAPVLLSASILAVILLGLHPLGGALMLTAPLALLLFVLGSWLLMRGHDRRLCEHCAASMPLNPAALAARYRRRFWLAHAGSQPRYLIPYLAVLLGSNFAAGPAGRVAWAIIQSSMIYLIMSHSAHRRLQPWCPWCRGDGGGEHESISPDPMPTSGVS